MISAARVRELVQYDKGTGIFRWRVSRWHGTAARRGENAGSVKRNGYVYLSLDDREYLAHRVAWLYVTGRWPKSQIDHRDGVRANNRYRNLRDVSGFVNQRNRNRANRNSKTGLLGVVPKRGRFSARMMVNRRIIELGTFDTAEAAHAAYMKAKRCRASEINDSFKVDH